MSKNKKKWMNSTQHSYPEEPGILIRELYELTDNKPAIHFVEAVTLIMENEVQWSPGEIIAHKILDISVRDVLVQLSCWYSLDNLDDMSKFKKINKKPHWSDVTLYEVYLACYEICSNNAWDLPPYFKSIIENKIQSV